MMDLVTTCRYVARPRAEDGTDRLGTEGVLYRPTKIALRRAIRMHGTGDVTDYNAYYVSAREWTPISLQEG
jgi:hypothetical protein